MDEVKPIDSNELIAEFMANDAVNSPQLKGIEEL